MIYDSIRDLTPRGYIPVEVEPGGFVAVCYNPVEQEQRRCYWDEEVDRRLAAPGSLVYQQYVEWYKQARVQWHVFTYQVQFGEKLTRRYRVLTFTRSEALELLDDWLISCGLSRSDVKIIDIKTEAYRP